MRCVVRGHSAGVICAKMSIRALLSNAECF